jgi:hypothetical protein
MNKEKEIIEIVDTSINEINVDINNDDFFYDIDENFLYTHIYWDYKSKKWKKKRFGR